MDKRIMQNKLIAEMINLRWNDYHFEHTGFDVNWNMLMMAVAHIEDKMKHNGRSLQVKMSANRCVISADRWSDDGEDFGSTTDLVSSDRVEQTRKKHTFEAVYKFLELQHKNV